MGLRMLCMIAIIPACMLHFDLVSILFGNTSFNMLVKKFLHLFHCFLLCVTTCINLLTFLQSSTSLAFKQDSNCHLEFDGNERRYEDFANQRSCMLQYK